MAAVTIACKSRTVHVPKIITMDWASDSIHVNTMGISVSILLETATELPVRVSDVHTFSSLSGQADKTKHGLSTGITGISVLFDNGSCLACRKVADEEAANTSRPAYS